MYVVIIERLGFREKGRSSREGGRGEESERKRHAPSDWDTETPRTGRRYGGMGGETPYSKIRGKDQIS